jgi:hypothetical protein
MRRIYLVFLVATMLLTKTGFAQRVEGRSGVNETTARADAVRKTRELLEGLKRATSCPLQDPEGLVDEFLRYAWVEVSSTYSHEIKKLNPEEYLVLLNGLRCGPGAIYGHMLLDYDPINLSAISITEHADTMIITVPVLQFFQGIGLNPSRTYCDRCLKNVQFAYYYDSRFLMGKIRCITVGFTTNIKK